MAASVKILFRKDKINQNGEIPLYLRIIKNRNSQQISLGIAVPEKYWDAKNKRVKKGLENSQRLNNYITHKLAEAEGHALELETKSKTINSKNIKEAVIGKAPESFFKYADRYFTEMENKLQASSIDKTKHIIGKVKKYNGGGDITFDELDVTWLKKYDFYLRHTLKNSNNTVVANFKLIRRIINEAIKEDIITYDKNPFLKFKLKWENTKKEFLTEEEILLVENLELEDEPATFNARNMYIFATYAGGMRISDLVQLKWSNYDGDRILLNTQKTNSTISVKLPQKAKDILKLYYYDDVSPNEFIFPYFDLSKDYNDGRYLYRAISSAGTMCNKELVKIADLARIDKHIHFHTSRHTWATRALKKGMRIEYVSKLMGHASIKTTQVYAKIVNEDLDRAMEVFN
ncbi:MAG: site-specific integrase [Bacteroidia bacterium]